MHCAFFRAGASIATTASYQASFDGFAERGISRNDAARLLRRSVELAKAARDEVRRISTETVGGRVRRAVRRGTGQRRGVRRPLRPVGRAAGGLAPAAAGDPGRRRSRRAGAGDGARHRRGRGARRPGSRARCPAWLSYTIAGTTTRAGQPLADAFAVAAGVPEIVAVGVNCCAPADVEHAVRVAREVTGKPVIVYPNSGEEWDGERRTWIGKASGRRTCVPRWAAAGARIIGGCCRVQPDDIAALRVDCWRSMVRKSPVDAVNVSESTS